MTPARSHRPPGRYQPHLLLFFLLPLLTLRTAGVCATFHRQRRPSDTTTTTIRYPLPTASIHNGAALHTTTAATTPADATDTVGVLDAGFQMEHALTAAITTLNSTELPDARAALAGLRHDKRTFPCVACGWAATLLTSEHTPRATKLVAKSHSQAAQLDALVAERANISDAQERVRLAALRTLCSDNEKAAARLQH
jgi:hypothetical protein